MSLRGVVIPANIRAAARRAGLRLPDWWVGPVVDPSKPRTVTLQSIVEQVEREEAEASQRGRSDR